MTNLICNRFLFRHDNDIVEPLLESRATWTLPQLDLVKKRSAFFKPLILYLQDDPLRRPEEIGFYTPVNESDNDHFGQGHADTFSPTSLPHCVDFENDFRGFLRDLVSTEAISNSLDHLAPFCKCAWMCKCPPEVFQIPTTILNRRRRVVVISPTSSPQVTNNVMTPPSSPARPWDLTRQCGCNDDACTCSLELAHVCLWLGWEQEFKKHLKAAIWSASYAGVAIRTPIKQLRNLWEIRNEAAEMLRADLEQYLEDHEQEYEDAIKKQPRGKIKSYLKTKESFPGSVGRAIEKLFLSSADTNDVSPQAARPNHNRRVSVHTSGETSLSSAGSGVGQQNPGQVKHAAKDAYDFGIAGSVWNWIEKSKSSSQDKYNTFVKGVFDHLTEKIDARQEALANSIWEWREREMREWKWVLGI
ncbi:hypothetical protein B0T21DRAFT_410737 [Apiosordaria backusii]|uniref:Uncharacterized protein n=1 Tax=Apiosordaria backusii TaxID=314023 RepID=A0AA40BN35_9PEZI|nr:hypothetical protein B0T21DRAFT_410737 [Apiosordaria backusii]